MEQKDYVIAKTFERMSPEEMYMRNLNRITKADQVRKAVDGLERDEAVLVPQSVINETSVRVAVMRINNGYKEMYKREGFSDRLRKYSVHREETGIAIARTV